MDRAQGAIDAARAAGADRYAATEYTAATDALKNANDAVAQGDYRLALNHALASHERAQSAAGQAAARRAQARGEVERAMAELRARLAQADALVELARKSRRPRRTVDESSRAVAAVRTEVEQAKDAIAKEEYLAVGPTLNRLQEQLEKAIALVAPAPAQAQPRRR